MSLSKKVAWPAEAEKARPAGTDLVLSYCISGDHEESPVEHTTRKREQTLIFGGRVAD